jgi:hypothetical protein
VVSGFLEQQERDQPEHRHREREAI